MWWVVPTGVAVGLLFVLGGFAVVESLGTGAGRDADVGSDRPR